jgi:hypothetical protein
MRFHWPLALLLPLLAACAGASGGPGALPSLKPVPLPHTGEESLPAVSATVPVRR